MSERPSVRSLDAVDEKRVLELGRVEVVRLGGVSFERATFRPGWRWSTHAGEGLCQERHLGYLIAGRMCFAMSDGTRLEAGAGDVYLVPPGHDAWVVGDEPCSALDLG